MSRSADLQVGCRAGLQARTPQLRSELWSLGGLGFPEQQKTGASSPAFSFLVAILPLSLVIPSCEQSEESKDLEPFLRLQSRKG